MRNDNDGRPDPLNDALAKKGPIPAAAGAILSLLVGAGILSTTGVTVVGIVLAGLAALVTVVTSAATAWKVIAAARAGVTPSGDPRTDTGEELVPRTGQLLAEVLEQILDAGGLVGAATPPTATSSPAPGTAPMPLLSPPSAREDQHGQFHRDDLIADDEAAARRAQPATTQLPPPPAGGRHSSRR